MKLILSDRSFQLPAIGEPVKLVDLSKLNIAHCVGCFGCWVKTPREMCHTGRRCCRVSSHCPKHPDSVCQPGQIRRVRRAGKNHAGAGYPRAAGLSPNLAGRNPSRSAQGGSQGSGHPRIRSPFLPRKKPSFPVWLPATRRTCALKSTG